MNAEASPTLSRGNRCREVRPMSDDITFAYSNARSPVGGAENDPLAYDG
jgi:hypothetical protein